MDDIEQRNLDRDEKAYYDSIAAEEMIMSETKSKKVKKIRKISKHKSTSKANGVSTVPTVIPAPKDGPNLTLRMRSKATIGRVHKAAKKAGVSMNTWAIEVLERASEAQIA